MRDDPKQRSPLVNALWGAGIEVPRPTRDQWIAAKPLLLVQFAVTLLPAALTWVLIGELTGAWGWGGGAAAAVFLTTSIVLAVVVAVRDARRSRRPRLTDG